jgi:hypothetical protein
MNGRLITAKEVAEDLECSMQHAYKIVKILNGELDEMGCIMIRGKTNRSYYKERLFGIIDEIDLSELETRIGHER